MLATLSGAPKSQRMSVIIILGAAWEVAALDGYGALRNACWGGGVGSLPCDSLPAASPPDTSTYPVVSWADNVNNTSALESWHRRLYQSQY
jgi:hypothetical protein